MSILVVAPETVTLKNVKLAMEIIAGFEPIADALPNATITIDIGETLLGWRFDFLVAGRKNQQQSRFYAGYLPGASMDGVERTMADTGKRLLPILSRVALHNDAIAKNIIPASDIKVPSFFRKMLDDAGMTGVDFLTAIGGKTTSWNDAGHPFGRKVKRLPLDVMTAGEFKNDEIQMLCVKDPAGAELHFIHSGGTPIYSFQGKIPEVIADPLLGRPVNELVEAPTLARYGEYFPIRKFDYPTYGSPQAMLASVENVPLGDEEPQLDGITADMKTRIEEWLGLSLDADSNPTQ